MRFLPVGISQISPEKPPTQVHSGILSSFTSAHVPPFLHGLGLQAEFKIERDTKVVKYVLLKGLVKHFRLNSV